MDSSISVLNSFIDLNGLNGLNALTVLNTGLRALSCWNAENESLRLERKGIGCERMNLIN